MRTARLGAIMTATAILSACSSGGGSPAVPAASTSAIASMSAASYVDLAASAALYAVEAAKLAETRARDRDIRDLARLQGQAGTAIGGQLAFAGPRVNAVPDNVLTAEHQAMLDALRTASDFDDLYLEQQKRLVPQMRALHENYAVIGGSATLRPVAEFGAGKMAAQAEAVKRAD